MNVDDMMDDEPKSLEQIREEMTRDAGPASSPREASEEGRSYSPPTEPPIRPGGEDSARHGARTVSDDPLTHRIVDALDANPTTAALDFDIIVEDGIVQLQGQVQRPADAEEAVAVVSGVSGVSEVMDELDVLELPER